MDIKAEEVLNFQLKRLNTNLYKSFLILVEDIQHENINSFNKLKRLSPEKSDSIDCANFLDEAKMEYLRKKILDAGNDCIRNMEREIKKFEISLKLENIKDN